MRHIAMRNISFTSVVRVGQKIAILSLSWDLPCKHGCGILISDGILSGLHFLVLNEFIMPFRIIDISVVPSVIR